MTERRSKTYQTKVGCGNLFITLVFNSDDSFRRVWIHRCRKFKCSVTSREKLARQTTFQMRRDLKQAIRDLKGEMCEECNIVVKSALKRGKLAGFSCADALSRVLERALNEEKEEKKRKSKEKDSP